MWNKFINSKFLKKWATAFSIIFSPGFLISAMVTGVSLYLSVSHKTNVPFSNTMAIIGSVFGGIAGAFFKDEYDRVSGKNILEKKGRSALRNLQGISTQLNNIKTWVIEFSKRSRKQEDKRTLEEINRHIMTIELNISSGLEDWVDIVPELKEKSQKEAEMVKKYKEAAQSVMIELLEKRKELAATKDEKIEQELKKKINDLEKQINEIRKERTQAVGSIDFMPSGIINEHIGRSSFNVDNGVFASGLGTRVCSKCGKRFSINYLSASPYIYNNNYCDNCKREIKDDLTDIN